MYDNNKKTRIFIAELPRPFVHYANFDTATSKPVGLACNHCEAVYVITCRRVFI